MSSISIAIVLGATAILAGANGAEADVGASFGIHAGKWRVDGTEGSSRSVELQVRMTARFAFQVEYRQLREMPAAVADLPLRAIPPDLRGGIVITPIPNRYFAPFLYFGGGTARYAQDRVNLLAGLGAEVRITPWMGVVAQWTVAAPDPFEVAQDIQQRADHQRMAGARPVSGMQDYYDLKTTEVTVGYRLVF